MAGIPPSRCPEFLRRPSKLSAYEPWRCVTASVMFDFPFFLPYIFRSLGRVAFACFLATGFCFCLYILDRDVLFWRQVEYLWPETRSHAFGCVCSNWYVWLGVQEQPFLIDSEKDFPFQYWFLWDTTRRYKFQDNSHVQNLIKCTRRYSVAWGSTMSVGCPEQRGRWATCQHTLSCLGFHVDTKGRGMWNLVLPSP